MRIYRIGLVLAWMIVASLAVAGFAAFTATDDDSAASAEAVTIAAVSPDLGRSAGAVAGLSFIYFVNGQQVAPTSFDAAPVDSDPVAPRTTITVAEPESTSDTRGSVFIRSRFLNETAVRELASRYFAPDDVTRAVRIAWCESSFNPSAVNPVTGAAGLFQHLPEDWASLSIEAGWPGTDPLDPEANVAVAAWKLYNVPGGWSHWECQA